MPSQSVCLATIVAVAVLALTALPSVAGQNLPLPPLPYEMDALEPHMDAATVRVHYLKHHQGYTNKLNAILGPLRADPEYKHLAKLGIDRLLWPKNLAQVPEDKRTGIRNFGGGYVNHDLFWNSMSPTGGGSPSDEFEAALRASFGSVAEFSANFKRAAVSVFGSGYAWLVHDAATGSLSITTTSNQDTPASETITPILVLDVWEHAYYLKFQNRRASFVDTWLEQLVNWEVAEQRYLDAEIARANNDEL